MPRVTVMPGNFEIDVEPGEALAQAAWRQGYEWPTTCWGELQCTVCAAVLLHGEEAVEPAEAQELAAISERMPHFRRKPGTRLACRLKVKGDGVVVEKHGLQAP